MRDKRAKCAGAAAALAAVFLLIALCGGPVAERQTVPMTATAVTTAIVTTATATTVPPTEPTQTQTVADSDTTTAATETTVTRRTTTAAPTTTTTRAPITSFEQVPLAARNAFVYDPQKGVVFSKGDMQERLFPASTTKLYTALVALRFLSPQDVATAGDELKLVDPEASLAHIKQGQRLTVVDLVRGMMLPSGGDAAYILAAAAGQKISGESGTAAVKAFMDEVDRQTAADGLVGTHFVNPDGIHNDDHYSCMQDLLHISQMALECDTIAAAMRLQRIKVLYVSGQTNTWTNTNLLLDTKSAYYRKNVIGLKTGFTDEAGLCLLAAEKTDRGVRIVGVFGCKTQNDRFKGANALLDAAEELL